MARIHKNSSNTGQVILLVDDDGDYLSAAQTLLEAEGHRVLVADNGPQALDILRRKRVDLVLLDYFMPDMTGEEVVAQLREFNPLTQVILVTGYAADKPGRGMMRRLDIQGYCDKGEGPDKLLLWTEVGLSAAYTLQLLEKNRRGLRYILDVTPDLHRLQPLEDLLQGILWQVAGLLGAVDSFVAVMPERQQPVPANDSEGFLALLEDGDLKIRAATGRFSVNGRLDEGLDREHLRRLRQVLEDGETCTIDDSSIAPLRVGERIMGAIYLDRPTVHERDVELLELFGNQAAVAIHNAQLHEMATLDALTGVGVRGFFDQCVLRELRDAFRSQEPLALLLLDVDCMKQINDRGGHLAGDQALALVGQVMRQTLRATDVAGRYGGDEFAAVLPNTNARVASDVAERLLEAFEGSIVTGTNGRIPVRCSVGIASLQPPEIDLDEIPRPIPNSLFEDAATVLFSTADTSLYAAKSQGRGRLGPPQRVAWPLPKTGDDELVFEEVEQPALLMSVG